MNGVAPLTLLLLLCLAHAVPTQPLQDEVVSALESSKIAAMSIAQIGSPLMFQAFLVPSPISDDEDQTGLIREKRGYHHRDSPYCRGPHCRRNNRRRQPWRPTYLLTQQEKNRPINHGYKSRKMNNGAPAEEVYIPKRSDSDTLFNPAPTYKPIMYIADPKPISHPKKSKGVIRRIA
ncbi:unnamed protein product [Meganyctiphanes norvegica]|uniref:Uncharacterized protein n=1 Tax=Meganyctiphanes norvegica TaxID=48144 RepID=A0AAV2RQ07_MEGNR